MFISVLHKKEGIRLKFKFLNTLRRIPRVPRQDIPYMIILLSVTVITRLLLIMNAPFVYHIDSYAYLTKAIDFATTGTIHLEIGMPFVVLLGVLFKIFGFTLGIDLILLSRFFMLLMTSLIVLIIYLFGQRMSGRILGLSAALLAVFEPYFLSYSIVPHIDVFAVIMGLLALYFAFTGSKSRYVLVIIFFYLATASKVELYLTLLIPILIFYFCKNWMIRSIRAITRHILIVLVYVLPVIWVYERAVLGRISIVERFRLFFKPELLRVTLGSTFTFYDQPLLNQVFLGLVTVGCVLGLLNVIVQYVSFSGGIGLGGRGRSFLIRYKRNGIIKHIFHSDNVMIALCLLLSFVIHIVILTTYGFGYVVTEGIITIIPNLPRRYMIFPRLLITYPLAYPLTLITRRLRLS